MHSRRLALAGVVMADERRTKQGRLGRVPALERALPHVARLLLAVFGQDRRRLCRRMHSRRHVLDL